MPVLQIDSPSGLVEVVTTRDLHGNWRASLTSRPAHRTDVAEAIGRTELKAVANLRTAVWANDTGSSSQV